MSAAERGGVFGRGSLRGELVLADGWDSPETNAAIAADFGETHGHSGMGVAARRAMSAEGLESAESE